MLALVAISGLAAATSFSMASSCSKAPKLDVTYA